MELGEAGVRHPQLDRGNGGLDRVYVLPVDVALRKRQPEVAGQDPPRAFDPQPAEEPGRADVDRDDVELALDLVEPEVVDPDDLPAVDVDDLLVEQVTPQADLLGTLLEAADVDHLGPEAGPQFVKGRDGGPRQEDLAPVGPGDKAGDRRIAVADGDDQVRDLADRLALGVEHGPADRLAQIEHVPPRGRVRPRRRWRLRISGGGGSPQEAGADRWSGAAQGGDGTGSGLHVGSGPPKAGWAARGALRALDGSSRGECRPGRWRGSTQSKAAAPSRGGGQGSRCNQAVTPPAGTEWRRPGSGRCAG